MKIIATKKKSVDRPPKNSASGGFGYGSIPIDTFLVGWTSIYQLFWCSPGVQGFDPSPFHVTKETGPKGAFHAPVFWDQSSPHVREGPFSSSPHSQIFCWSKLCIATWWLIPLSKWVITPVINGISRVNPLITGVITHLLSGMSHQVSPHSMWIQSHNPNLCRIIR